MSLVTKTLAPVRRVAHQFFRCHLQLNLRDGVRVELVERRGVPQPPTVAELAAERERAELAQIAEQLRQALDEDGDARHQLRHLAFVEQSLAQDGLAALYTVPVDVLQRALVQFEDLVSNWTPEGLACLRSRMAVALRERDPEEPETQAAAYRGVGGR
jgi:hypothetical protein